MPLACVTASDVVAGSEALLWPLQREAAQAVASKRARHASCLDVLVAAESQSRPTGNGRPTTSLRGAQYKRTGNAAEPVSIDRDPANHCASGESAWGSVSSDASDESRDRDLVRKPSKRGNTRPAGSSTDGAATGGSFASVAASASAGGAPPTSSVAGGGRGPGRTRPEAWQNVQRVIDRIREVRAEEHFSGTDRRAVVDEALSRESNCGNHVWGLGELYTRRRTVLDTCLKFWPEDMP